MTRQFVQQRDRNRGVVALVPSRERQSVMPSAIAGRPHVERLVIVRAARSARRRVTRISGALLGFADVRG